jgi:FkbM family methyltransferase
MKYYGQFKPSVDEIIHKRYFKNRHHGISIEAGALDGVWDSSTYFFKKNFEWNTINIEPLNNMFQKLIINRPNSINLNLALSNKNGITIIKNYKHPTLKYDWGNASLQYLPQHERGLQNICGKENYIEQEIKTITYSSLIKEQKINELDLFVLDVEGHEYEVIDGMKDAEIFPKVFVIEHGHRTPEDIVNKLKVLPVSYKLDHISHVNSYFVRIDE